MGDEKKLMPELLPKALSAPSSPARQRVLNQLRVLTATSAATISLISFSACGDPLISPPACRSTRGVAASLGGFVTPGGGFSTESDGGTALPDGGTPPLFTLAFGSNDGSVSVTQVILATNVARSEYRPESMEFVFQPADPALPIELRFTTTCGGAAGLVLRADLVPNGLTYTVTLSDVP